MSIPTTYDDAALRARLLLEHETREWKEMAREIARTHGKVHATTLARFAYGGRCTPRVAKILLETYPPTVASETRRLAEYEMQADPGEVIGHFAQRVLDRANATRQRIYGTHNDKRFHADPGETREVVQDRWWEQIPRDGETLLSHPPSLQLLHAEQHPHRVALRLIIGQRRVA